MKITSSGAELKITRSITLLKGDLFAPYHNAPTRLYYRGLEKLKFQYTIGEGQFRIRIDCFGLCFTWAITKTFV